MIGIVGILHLNNNRHGTARCVSIVDMVYQRAVVGYCTKWWKLKLDISGKIAEFDGVQCLH